MMDFLVRESRAIVDGDVCSPLATERMSLTIIDDYGSLRYVWYSE